MEATPTAISLGHLVGAVYDPARQYVVLVGDGDVEALPFRPAYLAVALRCVLGEPECDPQFSLDPADPTEPDGPWQQAVYIPETVVGGTAFGQAMYEADWLLKQYCFGVALEPGPYLSSASTDVQGFDGVEVWSSGKARAFVKKERWVNVSGFQNLAQLTFEATQAQTGEVRRARQWIVPEEVSLKTTEDACVFSTVEMRVEARRQEIGADGRLRDTLSDEPLTRQFAQLATQLYDEIAAQEPAFDALRELAKTLAIARWLAEQQIPVDLSWIHEALATREDVIARVTRLTATHERRSESPLSDGARRGIVTTIHQVTLSGGVDLTVRPVFAEDDGAAAALRGAVCRTREVPADTVFVIRNGQQQLTAWVLPARPPLPPIVHRPETLSPPERRVNRQPLCPPPGTTVVRLAASGVDLLVTPGAGAAETWPQVFRALVQVEGGNDEGDVLAQQIVRGWRERGWATDGGTVLLVHDTTCAIQVATLRALLAQAYRTTTFVTTTDPGQALTNLQSLRPVREGGDANVGVCIAKGTLSAELYEALMGSALSKIWANVEPPATRIAELSRESNILLVVAHTDERLLGELEAAARVGGLKGKAIILWSCGDCMVQAPAMRLIGEGGASLVWRAQVPIDARLIGPLSNALRAVISQPSSRDATRLMDDVLDQAIERAETELQSLVEGRRAAEQTNESERAARLDAERSLQETLLENLRALRKNDLMSERSGVPSPMGGSCTAAPGAGHVVTCAAPEQPSAPDGVPGVGCWGVAAAPA